MEDLIEYFSQPGDEQGETNEPHGLILFFFLSHHRSLCSVIFIFFLLLSSFFIHHILHFAYLDFEEKQNRFRALRSRQDLFQEEGVLNMILDTIDKFSQMEALPDFAGLIGEETHVMDFFYSWFQDKHWTVFR